MALLSYDEEYERAHDVSPFSNGFEGETWMDLWCVDCAKEPDCPLLVVALMGRTPRPWTERQPMSLNRYTCHEYDDVSAEHQPSTVGEV